MDSVYNYYLSLAEKRLNSKGASSRSEPVAAPSETVNYKPEPPSYTSKKSALAGTIIPSTHKPLGPSSSDASI